jgi:hypothetical protein
MLKRNYIFLFILIVAFTTSSLGQSRTEIISNIKQSLKKINSDGSLKIKTINDAEKFLGYTTDGGGELKGYFKNDSIQKITEWVGLSFGTIQNDYYFRNNQLIFVYEIEKHFAINDKTQEINYEKLELAFEARYYFSNQKLIEVKTKGKTAENSTIDFVKESKTYSKMLSAIK